MDYAKVSLEKHYEWKGKLEVVARAAVDNKEALFKLCRELSVDNEVYIIDAPHIIKVVYKTPIYVYSIFSALMGMLISIVYIRILMKIEKNVK